MNYLTITAKLFLILNVVLLLPISCEILLSEQEKTERNLIGTWIMTSVSNDFSVEGVDIDQYLITEYGLSEVEAELFEAELIAKFTGLSLTVTFNEDYTAHSLNNGEQSNGTWSASSDGNTLVLDEGTMFEVEMAIISLTSSSLVLQYPPGTMDVDIDEDQLYETTLTTVMKISFSKE